MKDKNSISNSLRGREREEHAMVEDLQELFDLMVSYRNYILDFFSQLGLKIAGSDGDDLGYLRQVGTVRHELVNLKMAAGLAECGKIKFQKLKYAFESLVLIEELRCSAALVFSSGEWSIIHSAYPKASFLRKMLEIHFERFCRDYPELCDAD